MYYFKLNTDSIREKLNQWRKYEMYKEYGKNIEPFKQTISYIKYKMKSINVEYVLSQVNIEDMTFENFYFIFCNIANLKKYMFNINTVVGFDSEYKSYLNENKIYPIYAITCMDCFGRGIPVYLLVTYNENSEIIKNCIRDISNHFYNTVNLTFSTIFMIDDSGIEKEALDELGIFYIICKFHLLRNFRKKVNKS